MAAARVDAEGLRVFAKQMRALSPKLGVALAAELRSIGNEVRDEIRTSTAVPFGPVDSKGRVGRKRQTIKTSATQRGVSLYSLEPDAGVWNWGGVIRPRGTPITIPRTEFVSGTVAKAGEGVAEKLGGLLDGLARRYAQFT